MKREIKFRGKRVDTGEWVYGSLVKYSFHNSIDYVEQIEIVELNAHAFEVHPETVGQYTGLKDKHGIEIYEGDIIAYYPYEGENRDTGKMHTKLFVEWDKIGAFVLKLHPSEVTTYATISEECFDNHYPHQMEIAGNIHDNPELLK